MLCVLLAEHQHFLTTQRLNVRIQNSVQCNQLLANVGENSNQWVSLQHGFDTHHCHNWSIHMTWSQMTPLLIWLTCSEHDRLVRLFNHLLTSLTCPLPPQCVIPTFCCCCCCFEIDHLKTAHATHNLVKIHRWKVNTWKKSFLVEKEKGKNFGRGRAC